MFQNDMKTMLLLSFLTFIFVKWVPGDPSTIFLAIIFAEMKQLFQSPGGVL